MTAPPGCTPLSLFEIVDHRTGWIIQLTDQIDPLNFPRAIKEIAAAIETDPPRHVLLGLDAVTHMQSSSIGMLVDLKHQLDRQGVKLELTGLKASVQDALRCMNLDRVLPIATDSDAAMAAWEEPGGHTSSLSKFDRPHVARLTPRFGEADALPNRVIDELGRYVELANPPRVVLDFVDVDELDHTDAEELARMIERIEARGGSCAGARMSVDLLPHFQRSGLAGRLMLYPTVSRAKVALLAGTAAAVQ